jgi:hypothetical protein
MHVIINVNQSRTIKVLIQPKNQWSHTIKPHKKKQQRDREIEK